MSNLGPSYEKFEIVWGSKDHPGPLLGCAYAPETPTHPLIENSIIFF